MGICISSASTEIPETKNDGENVIIVEGNMISNGAKKKHGSLYSKQGSKGLNQDAAVLFQGYGIEEGDFCGVFDGHGKNGHVVSTMVRNHLPSLLLNQKNARTETDMDHEEAASINELLQWKAACVGAFMLMDKEIKLQYNFHCSCSGSTAVVVIRQGGDLVIANLGDSRAVLGTMTANGIIAVQLTTDLKPGLPREAERIRNSNGRVMSLNEEPHIPRVWLPNEDAPGLAMSRAFGDFLLKDYGVIVVPDVSSRRLTSNDRFVLLASDGVWDVLSNNQVASIVWMAENEEIAAKAVVDAATVAWKKRFTSSSADDCTAVCLFLQN